MRFPDSLKKKVNEGRKESIRNQKNNDKVGVKLVEPNCGRIVTMQVMVEEPILHMYICQIKEMAECLEATKVSVSDKIVSIEFPDAIRAEAIRETFK